MIHITKREIHPHLLLNHGDDINDPPPDGYERFGLQNANGIARGNMEVFDVIEAAEDLHLGIF